MDRSLSSSSVLAGRPILSSGKYNSVVGQIRYTHICKQWSSLIRKANNSIRDAFINLCVLVIGWCLNEIEKSFTEDYNRKWSITHLIDHDVRLDVIITEGTLVEHPVEYPTIGVFCA